MATDGAQDALRTHESFRKARHYYIRSEWRQRGDEGLDCGGRREFLLDSGTGARDIIQRMRLSARNRLVGVMTEIKLGDIMAHVTIKVGSIRSRAITRRSAEEMSLHLGDTVAAVIKSTEVMVEKA